MRWVLALAVLLAIPFFWALPARAETLTVFAAASLKNAFDAIGEAFAAETGEQIVFSYAGTSALARQIEQGAPADVFASANTAWTNYLADRNALVAGSTVAFAGNALAVIAPIGSAGFLNVTRADSWLSRLGEDGRIAVALTNAVPAGIYAREALEGLGIWPEILPRLAQTDNVRAALFLVSRGEAPLGIVYATDAMAEPEVELAAEIPNAFHTPISYTASQIADSENPLAEQFLMFLMQAEAQRLLQDQGFGEASGDGT